MAQKHQGLLFVYPGAPNTPHVIEGLPGYYSPAVPHPVGDDLSLEAAKAAVKQHPDLLKLVDIPAGKVEEAAAHHRGLVSAGRNELVQARRDGRAQDDVTRTKDEHDAVKEA